MTSLIGSGSGWARNLKSKRAAVTPQRNGHWGKRALAMLERAWGAREWDDRSCATVSQPKAVDTTTYYALKWQ